MRSIRGTLHTITRGPEPHTFELSVSIGDASPRIYRVSHRHYEKEGNLNPAKIWFFEDLLTDLTKLGNRGFVNNWIYQKEMWLLLEAFDAGETMPDLPVELGTTRFWRPPGILRILRNRIMMRFFWRRGLFLPPVFSHQPASQNRSDDAQLPD